MKTIKLYPTKFSRMLNIDNISNKPCLKYPYNTQCVGIINITEIDDDIVFSDRKLFPKNRKNQVLFKLIECIINDHNERNILENNFIIDPTNTIKLKDSEFTILVPELFLIELKKIMDHGLKRAYELKEDNLEYMRGKLQIKQQISNEIHYRPKIACQYWDLTTNIFINQVILQASNIISKDPKISLNIRSRITAYINQIRQEFVEEREIFEYEFLKPRFIPKRYESAFVLAKAIICNKYHGIDKAELDSPSFLINAANVWEAFLRSCIREAFTDWDPRKFTEEHYCLYKEDRAINITPDIICSKENKFRIMDVKYKAPDKVPATDLYQMCAYISHFKYFDLRHKSFLLYLNNKDTNVNTEKYEFKPEKDKYPIYIIYLDFNEVEPVKDSKEFKLLFSEYLKKKINECN